MDILGPELFSSLKTKENYSWKQVEYKRNLKLKCWLCVMQGAEPKLIALPKWENSEKSNRAVGRSVNEGASNPRHFLLKFFGMIAPMPSTPGSDGPELESGSLIVDLFSAKNFSQKKKQIVKTNMINLI